MSAPGRTRTDTVRISSPPIGASRCSRVSGSLALFVAASWGYRVPTTVGVHPCTAPFLRVGCDNAVTLRPGSGHDTRQANCSCPRACRWSAARLGGKATAVKPSLVLSSEIRSRICPVQRAHPLRARRNLGGTLWLRLIPFSHRMNSTAVRPSHPPTPRGVRAHAVPVFRMPGSVPAP